MPRLTDFVGKLLKSASAETPKKPSPTRRLGIMALEPRVMFDGAMVATVAAEHHVAEAAIKPTDGGHHDSGAMAHIFDAALPPVAAHTGQHEIVFVDSTLPDWQSLAQKAPSGAEVVMLDPTRDGMDQIAQALKGRTDIDAVHIVSHGGEGYLVLGNTMLSSYNLDHYSADMATIKAALTPDADIHLYGCDVAKGADGASFVEQLAHATGADVAASSNDTGVHGDWVLEISTGTMQTRSMSDASYGYDLATIEVTNLNDSGAGSLRAAISTATGNNAADTIVFDPALFASGAQTITLTSALDVGGVGNADALNIIGPGSSLLTISGNNSSRIFLAYGDANDHSVTNTSAFSLAGTTLANGKFVSGSGYGGGALLSYYSGNLTLDHVVIRNSSSLETGSYGGGVKFSDSSSSLSISNSTFDSNTATAVDAYGGGSQGGGLSANAASISISNSTFTNNASSREGGGASLYATGSVSITNTTFYGNSSGSSANGIGGGGAMDIASGSVSIVNSTIVGNHFVGVAGDSAHGGGGLSLFDFDTIQMTNTLVANNTSTNVTSNEIFLRESTLTGSNNIVGGTIGTYAGGTNSLTGTITSVPTLGALAYHGGAVKTISIGAGTAVDAGTATGAPATDARGYGRGSSIDIGAYEFNDNNTFGFAGSLYPPTGYPDMPNAGDLSIDLGVAVTAVAGKNIVIHNSDGSVFETIAATDSRITIVAGVAGAGSKVVINPTGTLAANAGYYVLIDAGAFKDASNNTFAGITGVAAWAFTAAVPPNVAPTLGAVTASAVGQGNAGDTSYSFTVSYVDSDGTIDGSSIGTGDVTVSKGGTSLTVTGATWDAATSTATYTVTPDGGSWNDADNGAWTVAIVGSQVIDNGGAYVAADASAGSFTVSMDTTPPAAPSAPDMAAGSDTGSSNTDNITADPTPTFTGTAEAGSTVQLYAEGFLLLGTTTADASGNWTFTPGSAFGTGALDITAYARDATGHTSVESSALSINLDSFAPGVSSVDVPADGTYATGTHLDFTVNFGEAVTVDTGGGTPRIAITLDTGGTVYADYLAGSGSDALTFRYTVASGNLDTDGITVGSLAANGGILRDVAGNDATLDLNSVGSTTAVLVDGKAPAIVSGGVPADGTYVAGQNLDFTVTYDEAVILNLGGGTPYLSVTLDTGSTVHADYVSGSGTDTLTFRYTVASGNLDSNGIIIGSAITGNGGSLKDAAGNDAATTGIAFGSTAAVLVDGVAPTVSSINRVTGAQTNASSVDYTVTFAENVSGVDTADFALTATGTAAGSIASVTQLNASTYTVTVNGVSGDGTLRLDLNGSGTGIVDVPGNAITAGYTAGQSYILDHTAPVVGSVAVPANGTYHVGGNLYFGVDFDSAVTVDTGGGRPRIAITLDTGGVVYADYIGGTGSTELIFRYTVAAGNFDADGIAVGALDANGSTLKDAAGNDATLTLNGVGNTTNVRVDAVVPTATIVVADNALAVGQTSTVTITFSEAVSGFSNADLSVANGTLSAVSSADGGVTWTATFTPTADISDASNLITLDNTGVTDTSGNTGFGTTDSNNYAIDTLRPTATVVVADSALTAGETSTVTITFNEAVSGLTVADLTVANGSVSGLASSDGGITWTATFTPTADITDASNLITLDNTGVADAAGNTGSGTADSNNYAIDTLRPTATIVVADNAMAVGETSTVTITFSEAVAGFSNADLTVANGSLSAVSSADGGITWTATFTPTADVSDASNLITLDNPGVQDASGNTGTGSTASNNYAIDTARPTATVVVADSALAAGETSTVTITFREAVTGFSNADLTVANGSLSAVSSADGGITWTATFTPTAGITDASNLITLDNTGVTDAAGNAGSGSTASNNYAIDALRPTATVVVADTALAAGETSTVTITFSEAVDGLTAADLTVANGSVSGLASSDGGVTWMATFTPTANVTDTSNLITLDNTGVTDVAGNTGLGTTASNNYSIDTLRPTATIVVADNALAVGETSTVTITFNEAISGFSNADLGVANGSLSAVSSTDGGITWTATFTPTVNVTDASNLITLDNTGVQDAAGNTGLGSTDSNNYAIDTARPTASIVVTDTALKAGETSQVTITFNEAVSGLTTADLTVANGSVSGLASSDGGITWTATFTPTTEVIDASNLITLDNTGVQDAAGNSGTGSTGSNSYAIDTARPTASIVVADTSLKIGETSQVTVTFSEAVSGLATADFAVEHGSLSGLTSSDGGITWTATFTPTADATDASSLISLDNAGFTDAAGNTGVGTTASNAYAVDTQGPQVVSISRDDSSPNSGQQGLGYTVTFDEDVSGLDATDFALVATGHAHATIGDVSRIDGHTWQVNLQDVGGSGSLQLNLAATGSGIADTAGNALATGADGEVYVVGGVTPVVLPPPTVLPTASGITHGNSVSLLTALQPDDLPTIFFGDAAPTLLFTLPVERFGGVLDGLATLSHESTPSFGDAVHDASAWPPSTWIAPGRAFSVRLPGALDGQHGVLQVSLADGRPLPSWLHFDPVADTLEGVPPADFSGTLSLQLTVLDGSGHVRNVPLELSTVERAPGKPAHVSRATDHTEKQPVAAAKPALQMQFGQQRQHGNIDHASLLHHLAVARQQQASAQGRP